MRKKAIIFGWLMMIAFLSHSFIQKKETSTCAISNSTTQDKEKLVYKIYYTWAGAYIGAGEATFSNEVTQFNQKTCYHFQGEGHSYSSYDWFFKVRDVYESYVDTNTLLPLKFTRKVHEGKTSIYDAVLFNHELKRATSTNGVYKTVDCIQDVLSSIYYARNIDFSKFSIHQKHYFSIFLDDKVESVYIEYLGKAKIKTKYGTYNCIKFKPKLIEGTIFKGGDEMTVYVSDDANKIPVLVETPIVVGKIKAYLIRSENIRQIKR